MDDVLKPCPECGYITLIQQIDFPSLTAFLYCPKCGYEEVNK